MHLRGAFRPFSAIAIMPIRASLKLPSFGSAAAIATALTVVSTLGEDDREILHG
jgi:hypothetical protein